VTLINNHKPGGSLSTFRSMFHGHEPSMETEPYLLPVRQSGTVCRSPSDQWRVFPVL